MKFLDRLKFLFTNRYPREYDVRAPRPRKEFYHRGGLGFTIYTANGGKILKLTDDDDDDETKLFILPDSDDIVDKIAKIVTLELIRK